MATFRRNGDAKQKLLVAVRNGMSLAASWFAGEMSKVVSKPGRGIVYVKPSGRKHRASAPGDPPTVDTGHYRRSIQPDLSKLADPNPTVRVGTNVKYGPRLEFGGDGVAPRPHWIPTLRKLRPKFISIVKNRIAADMKK